MVYKKKVRKQSCKKKKNQEKKSSRIEAWKLNYENKSEQIPRSVHSLCVLSPVPVGVAAELSLFLSEVDMV